MKQTRKDELSFLIRNSREISMVATRNIIEDDKFNDDRYTLREIVDENYLEYKGLSGNKVIVKANQDLTISVATSSGTASGKINKGEEVLIELCSVAKENFFDMSNDDIHDMISNKVYTDTMHYSDEEIRRQIHNSLNNIKSYFPPQNNDDDDYNYKL